MLNLQDSVLTIAVSGAAVSYQQQEVDKLEFFQAPNPVKVQEEILTNTKYTANNTGFFTGLIVGGLILTAVFVPLSDLQ